MAGRSLAWEDSSLPPEKKREARVTKLLQSPEPSWGVTETRSAFVYPRSLDPLRRVANISFGVEASDDEKCDGREQPTGSDVTRLLDKVFTVKRAEDVEIDAVRSIGAAGREGITGDLKSNDGSVDGHETVTSRGSVSNKGGRDEDRPGVPRVTTSLCSRRRDRNDSRASAVSPGNGPTAGRPVFHAYGNGNTSPATGGVVYGNYMLSHSIVPQVLPNKPPTRQVHAGTQRFAERAAARARAAGDRHQSSCKTLDGTASRNQNGIASRGERGGEFASRARSDHRVPDGGDGDHMEALARGRRGDSKEWRKQQRAVTTLQKPVLLFGALPDCAESRHPTKARRAPKARLTSAKMRRLKSHDPPTQEAGTPPNAPQAGATGSAEKHERQPVDGAESKSVDASCEEKPEEGGPLGTDLPPAALYTWTSDRHLVNDPRNYKFLPRSWAGELITPAGVPGPEPAGVEAVCLLRGEGRRRGRGGMRGSRRDHLEESGVDACMKWDPPGSR